MSVHGSRRGRHSFRELLLTELRRDLTAFLVTAGGLMVVYVYNIARYYRPDPDQLIRFFLNIVGASAALFVLAVVFGIEALRRDWQENTQYLLLSLPVRGWQVIGAKLAALAIQVMALALPAWAMVRTFLPRVQPFVVPRTPTVPVPLTLPGEIYLPAVIMGILVLLSLIGMTAYLVGRTAPRTSLATPWVITVAAMSVALLVWLRSIPRWSQGVTWPGNLSCLGWFDPQWFPRMAFGCSIDTARVLMSAGLALALLVACVLLWERRIEV